MFALLVVLSEYFDIIRKPRKNSQNALNAAKSKAMQNMAEELSLTDDNQARNNPAFETTEIDTRHACFALLDPCVSIISGLPDMMTASWFSRLLVVVIWSCGWMGTAHAANRFADSVTENFVPVLYPGACIPDVAVSSDGDLSNSAGYCPEPGQPTHEITLNFASPNVDEYYHGVVVWSNSGSIYTDDELREFDIEIDYTDTGTGLPATLSGDNVNIGDTTSANDPKLVTFTSIGGPSALSAITAVRITDLKSSGTLETAFREIQLQSDPPEIALIKTGVANDGGDGVVHSGDTITYTYTVTNTGDVTVFNIAVTEDAGTFTGSGATPNPALSSGSNDYDSGAGTPTDIRPGESVVFEATYTVTQADVDAGLIVNQADADGTDFHNDPASDTSGTTAVNDTPTTIGIPVSPQLSISKLADDDTERGVNDVVTYTYTITNTGNVNITNVLVSDLHNGFGPPPTPESEVLATDSLPIGDSTDAVSNGTWDLLAPGDIISFTGTYIVTQTDVDLLQ